MIKPDRIVSTTCPYCGVGCNLHLHIKDDFIFRVTSPFDGPVNHGNLCVKGRFGFDFMSHPSRITSPMIRKTPQSPGNRTQAFDRSEWREASWDEALDVVTERLCQIYEAHGQKAMGVYCCAKATNEDNYLMQKLYRAVFRTNNVDHCTRLCHAGSVVALQMSVGSAAMTNTASECVDSDVIIITGSNTAETHPIIAAQLKAAVHKHGTKLIVVDPRRVEMCNHAVMWLPERPGTDVPVFSAMAHVILKERLYNQKFIDERTEGIGEFVASMEPFTPEYAEMVSGVDRNLIVEAARMYATAKNAAIYWALGIPESTHGTDNALSLVHLALLTGHIGRPGTGLMPLRGQNNVQGASDAGAMPWHYPGYQRVEDERVAQKFERAWNVEPGGLNRHRGLTTTEILSSVGHDGVRALYIMGENPMMSEPNLTQTRIHMEQLEFLVAQDIFLNESSAYADVFLPATSWAEKEGTFTNTDRRVQRVRRAIPPRGLARPDNEIICDIAKRIEKRLGRTQSAGWEYDEPGQVMEEFGRLVPDYAGIRYHRIEEVGLQVPVLDETHPGTPVLFEKSFPRGKGLFHPMQYNETVEMPNDEFPLILTTGRVLEHWHGGSMTRRSNLDNLNPEARLEINALDAKRMNVSDGMAVRVTSRRGSVVARAWITPRASQGVVFLPFHFAEAAANLLTIDALDPKAMIPEYKACAVRVVPAEDSDLANPERQQARGRY